MKILRYFKVRKYYGILNYENMKIILYILCVKEITFLIILVKT